MEGFYEAWPRGKGFQKFTKLRIAFGDPLYPPATIDNPELAYERLTTELKSRVMDMWLELHQGRRTAPPLADPSRPLLPELPSRGG
jgi:hypothetical protein